MRLLLSALAVVLVTGCSALLDLQEPDYQLRTITTTPRIAIPLRDSAIDFDFLIEVSNPNSIALTLDGLEVDLFLNGEQVTRSVTSQNLRIPANGVADARLRTSLDYDSVRSLFSQIVASVESRQASYELRGKAWFQTPVGRLSFPISVRGRESL